MKNFFKKIHSYLSILILVNVLVKSFRKGLREVLLREEREAGYLSHDQFDTCLSRAKAILMEAIKKPLDMLTIAIAVHREKFHGEDHSKEIKEISRLLTTKEVKISTMGWWYG